MPAKNIKLTLEGLRFPADLDHSQKNFRLYFEFLYLDEEGDSREMMATLPPLKEDNWQWRNPDKENFVAHDDGIIRVAALKPHQRTVLWDKASLHQINLKIVDVEDKDVWDRSKPILQELSKLGFGTVAGLTGGVFLKLVQSLTAAQQAQVDQIIEQLTGNDNKVLFADSYAAETNNNLIPAGEIVFKGAGKGAAENVVGEYEVKLKLHVINHDE